MLDAGLRIGAGTDATRVASYNPWLSLAWLVTGKTVGGTQLASPENRLSREEALRLYTVGSAWFSGEEDVKGRIAPGQFAASPAPSRKRIRQKLRNPPAKAVSMPTVEYQRTERVSPLRVPKRSSSRPEMGCITV